MVLTGPGRLPSRFVKNVVVSIPDIAWIAPLPSPSMARSHGLLQPALGQLSTLDNLAGALAGIPAPRMGNTGETWQVLVVGASDEASGIHDLIQVYVGRRCLALARLHVAELATSSLHCVGRPSAASSDTHGEASSEFTALAHGTSAAVNSDAGGCPGPPNRLSAPATGAQAARVSDRSAGFRRVPDHVPHRSRPTQGSAASRVLLPAPRRPDPLIRSTCRALLRHRPAARRIGSNWLERLGRYACPRLMA